MTAKERNQMYDCWKCGPQVGDHCAQCIVHCYMPSMHNAPTASPKASEEAPAPDPGVEEIRKRLAGYKEFYPHNPLTRDCDYLLSKLDGKEQR